MAEPGASDPGGDCGDGQGGERNEENLTTWFNFPGVIAICRGRCASGQVIEQAHRFRERYGVYMFSVDPSAARLRETMIFRSLHAEVHRRTALHDADRGARDVLVAPRQA